MTLKELQAKREELAAHIRAMADRQADWTAEDQESWTKLNADYDSNYAELTAAVEAREAEQNRAAAAQARLDELSGHGRDLDARSARLRNSIPGQRQTPREPGRQNDDELPATEARALAFQSWFAFQSGIDLTERQQQACAQLRFNPAARNLDVQLAETPTFQAVQDCWRDRHPSAAMGHARRIRADLSATTGSAGGYTVPEGFVNSLEENMLAYGGMLQVSEIIRTESGNDLPWPTVDDTSNTGEILGESASIGSSVDPAFGQITWGAYKFSSKLVKVPSELLEDSAFNMPQTLGRLLGIRLGRISNTRFTTGTGTGQPRGIITAATLGVTANSATAIDSDELFDLFHSVDPAYRTQPRWMMHDNVVLYVRKLQDGNGQYLWISGIAMGQPDSLLGVPITINQDMASSVASTNKTILFGALNQYKVRQVRTVRFRRLVERFADNDQEGFVAFMRQDGNLLDAGTAPVKYLQQA